MLFSFSHAELKLYFAFANIAITVPIAPSTTNFLHAAQYEFNLSDAISKKRFYGGSPPGLREKLKPPAVELSSWVVRSPFEPHLRQLVGFERGTVQITFG